MVLPGSATSGGMRMGMGSALTLTEEDARTIEREIPGVLAVSGSMRGAAQVVRGKQNRSTVIRGTTPGYPDIRDWSLAEGRLFVQEDVDGAFVSAAVGIFFGSSPARKAARLDPIEALRHE